MANLNSRGRHNSLNGRRTTSGSPKSPAGALSFPTIKQRGYYSDILGEEAKNEIGVSIEVILDREQWPFRVSHSANLCLYTKRGNSFVHITAEMTYILKGYCWLLWDF